VNVIEVICINDSMHWQSLDAIENSTACELRTENDYAKKKKRTLKAS
jgi:hypothetical protein